MPARARLIDAQVTEIRQRREDGETMTALGLEFGVSRQHVSRLIAQQARPRIGGLDRAALVEGVSTAVDAYLASGHDRQPGDAVLAAAVRVVARKLDDCAASQSGTAAAAVPRLAGELVSLLDTLKNGGPREPDFIDALRHGREARLLANVAIHETRLNPTAELTTQEDA